MCLSPLAGCVRGGDPNAPPSVILACGHVVCDSCSDKLPLSVLHPRVVKCTLCSIAGVPYPLLSEAEWVNERCSSPTCVAHRYLPLRVCNTCGTNWCQNCTWQHSKRTRHTSFRHLVVGAHRKLPKCREHSCEYSMKCSCGELLCSECFTEHPYTGHNCTRIGQKSKLDEGAAKCTLDTLMKAKETVNLKLAELEQSIESTNEEIAETCRLIIEQTVTRCWDLMRQVTELGETNQNILIESRGNIDRLIRQTQRSREMRDRTSPLLSSPMVDYTHCVADSLLTESVNDRAVKDIISTLDSTRLFINICPLKTVSEVLLSIARLGKELITSSKFSTATYSLHTSRLIKKLPNSSLYGKMMPSGKAFDLLYKIHISHEKRHRMDTLNTFSRRSIEEKQSTSESDTSNSSDVISRLLYGLGVPTHPPLPVPLTVPGFTLDLPPIGKGSYASDKFKTPRANAMNAQPPLEYQQFGNDAGVPSPSPAMIEKQLQNSRMKTHREILDEPGPSSPKRIKMEEEE
ncbi:hypothetical protein PFISCL1PPCAC_20846, partial [Pristionchus fissidentatus]